MANASILAAFERMWQHVLGKLTEFVRIEDVYTKEEVDDKFTEFDAALAELIGSGVIE